MRIAVGAGGRLDQTAITVSLHHVFDFTSDPPLLCSTFEGKGDPRKAIHVLHNLDSAAVAPLLVHCDLVSTGWTLPGIANGMGGRRRRCDRHTNAEVYEQRRL